MQCHGGLKGPLRRIIRSLGNDRVSNSCRSPQRHLTGPATSSPAERCSPSRDDTRWHTFNGAYRPHAYAHPGPDGRSSRGHATRSIPRASHLGPEQREERAHDERQLSWQKQPKPTPAQPENISYGSKDKVGPIPEGSQEQSSYDASPKSVGSPPQRVVMIRYTSTGPIKDGNGFSERYKTTVGKVALRRSKNLSRAHQIQQERHNYASSEDWRVILRMLDANTTANPEMYKRRLETVMLPKGVLARFNSFAGASLREIMEHTGCHVQIARGATHCSRAVDAFAGLDLLGSSHQITHALKILPRYLDVIPQEEMIGTYASGSLSDHVLEHSIRSDEEMRLASLLASNSAQHLEHPSWDDGSDVDHIEERLRGKEGTSVPVTTRIRSVWAEDRTRRLNMYDALDERPKAPSNPLEVSACVADLCQRVPRGLHRVADKIRMPESEHDDVQIVTEELVSLFSTPEIASMATSHTVDRAINFLTKHGKFAAFREVYKALEDGGYHFTASSWNRCLAAAAKFGDVHNYRYTLKVMLRNDVEPNPVTWATLHDLMCRRFPEQAFLVVETMRDKGLLWDHRASRLVAQNSVAIELKAHLASGGNLATFFRFFDNRFNSVYAIQDFNWLTVDVVNRMVTVLLSFGRSHDAFEVLSEFHRRNGESALDTVTLNTFLASSFRDMDSASAVAMLQHFRVGQPGAIVPDVVTYVILFSIAWRRRYFNMLRVIWRYACANGHVGTTMRYRIQKSLKFSLPDGLEDGQKHSREHVWKAFAAKFAIGVGGGSHQVRDDAIPKESPLNELETQMHRHVSLGDLPKHSPQSEERWDFYRKTLAADSIAMGLSRPVLPLAELMQAAWEKDRDWKARAFGLPKNYSGSTFEEMLEDGIKVPMEERDGTLETRAWEVPALLRQAPKTSQLSDVGKKGEISSKGEPIV